MDSAFIRGSTKFVAGATKLLNSNKTAIYSGSVATTRFPTFVGRSYHSSNRRNDRSGNLYHGTTILCVRKNGKVCMMGDGMVSMGNMIVKPNAVKIQRLFPKGGLNKSTTDDEENGQKATIVGFAGATADAFTLLERLEGKLDEYPGQLSRSCVELAKGWRTDKYLRRLEASLIVADENKSLEITGNGDVLEMTDGVISIGSGSPFALGKFFVKMTEKQKDIAEVIGLYNVRRMKIVTCASQKNIAAARALMSVDDMSAEDVAKKAMNVASDMCVYTNKEFLSYTLNDISNTDEES